jgi:ribosomal protein S7
MFCQVKYGLKINTELDPQFIFFACLLAITPELMLKPLRLGSVTYGIPIPLTPRKQITFVLK